MLQTYAIANRLTESKYDEDMDLLLQNALNNAYFAHGHGYPYEVRYNFAPTTSSGTPGGSFHGADVPPSHLWVTSEAIGCALEGMLATLESDPW